MKSFLKSVLFVSFFLVFSTFSNAQPWVLKFNPSELESYVDCGTIDEYSLNEFTIETWLFVDNWSGNYIFSNESWSGDSGSTGFAFRLTASGQLEMNVGTGEWEAVKSPENTIKLKKWQHVAVSLNAEKSVKIYIDGALVAQGTLSKQMIPSGTNLFMGEGSMWQGRGFDGKMSDFRIWNLDKSAEDINTGKNIQLNGDENGLVANWLLNEGQGDTIADLTGNFNRTIGTGTSWVSKNNIQVNGSLKILTQGKDSVLVTVSNEVIAYWKIEKPVTKGKVTFAQIDSHSAYLIYETQTSDYQNDTILFAAVTKDSIRILAKVRYDLYINKYQYYGETLLDQIHAEFYNKSNGLYAESINAASQFVQGTSFVWPASHMLRALKNAWMLNPEKYKTMLYNYLEAMEQYKTTKSERTGFAVLPGDGGTRFYDDNGQVLMQYCGIYDLNQDSLALANLKIAYEFNNGIRDNQSGIPQHEAQLGAGMLFSMSVNYTSYGAAKLYQVTNETKYLDEALAYYETENDFAVKIKDAGTKLFNQTSYFQNGSWSLDGVVNGETQRGGGYRAYQTTVVIQNAILLYQITKDIKYLNDANEMINSCINMWYKPGQGLSENSFWGGDDMIDALMDLYRETADQRFITIAKDIMDFLSQNNRDKRGYYAGDADDSKGKWNLYRSGRNPSEVSLMGQAAAASSFLNVAYNSEEVPTEVTEFGIHENHADIRVYPNPVRRNEEIQIQMPEKTGSTASIYLYNQSGQLIQFFESVHLTNSQLITVCPTFQTPGIYFIHVNFEHNLYQTKLLIY